MPSRCFYGDGNKVGISGFRELSPDSGGKRGWKEVNQAFKSLQLKDVDFYIILIFTFSEKGLKLSQTELFL